MRLFFYGVLLEEVAQGSVRELLKGIGPGKHATARGKLYAVNELGGSFPAMVAGDGVVEGMLHEAADVDLAALDAFEGREFRRTTIAVEVGGESCEAQAYLWRGGVEALEPIGHGDFALWLAETGRVAIRD